MNGILIVDKKIGETSFDVIRDVRKKYNMKKVGHTGTLDPMATGVLPILLGDATKLSDFLMDHDKEYVAILKLGKKTNTGDSEGEVIEEGKIPKLETSKIEVVLKEFLGTSMQTPPMYSAIKVNGKKLYEYARAGEEIERNKRKIEIFKIELISYKDDEIEYKVNCSKGTYIRTLCEDISEKLGTVGYMKSLRRTRVGEFSLEDTGKIFSIEDVMKNRPKYDLKEGEKIQFLNGASIKISLEDGLLRVYFNNLFIGLGKVENGKLKRKIVLS